MWKKDFHFFFKSFPNVNYFKKKIEKKINQIKKEKIFYTDHAIAWKQVLLRPLENKKEESKEDVID